MEKKSIISIFKVKKAFNSQGNMIANKNIHFMGPLIYVLLRAPNSLKTALSNKYEKYECRHSVTDVKFCR